jgi:hypothetical protein
LFNTYIIYEFETQTTSTTTTNLEKVLELLIGQSMTPRPSRQATPTTMVEYEDSYWVTWVGMLVSGVKVAIKPIVLLV